MFWVVVLSLLIAFLYFVLIKPFNIWTERGVPQYPVFIQWKEIILGLVQYRPIYKYVENLYNDFSDLRYVGSYQFGLPTLILRDPELIKRIIIKDFNNFVDHNQIIPEDAEPIWEKNLVALKGDKWREMRATLSPSFTKIKMKVMFDVINESCQGFVKYFEEQKSDLLILELKDTYTRFTNDIIASTAFGITCDSLRNRNNEFYEMGKAITNFSGILNNVKLLLMLTFPRLAKFFGLTLFKRKIIDYFTQLVKQNIDYRLKNGIVRSDMLHLLLEAQKERTDQKEVKNHKDQLTDLDITAQALIFFFAGFESISNLMCFMSYELALNPDIQKRLQEEIEDAFVAGGGRITYDALQKMNYLDMVVSESLRKWPGGVAFDRVCTSPYTIPAINDNEKDILIEPGNVLWVPSFALHRDPKFFPDPLRFDPERFSDENKENIVPFSYIPFGAGPRSCIGNRFALMEAKTGICYLLKKFEIVVVDKTEIPVKLGGSQFQLTSQNGFWLGLKPKQIDL